MTKQVLDCGNPYGGGIAKSRKTRRLHLLTVIDACFIVIGSVSFVYCIVILIWPWIFEDWAVWIVAWKSGQTPRSGDYRYAWRVFVYLLPIAILLVFRILLGLMMLVFRRFS